jgi:hypothetical protein
MTETEKNNELNRLRSQNAKIKDAKQIIAHMTAICNANTDALVYMDRNVKGIKAISEHFTIPHYNEIFDDFDDYLSGGSHNVEMKEAGDECKKELDSIGEALDKKMEEIAKEIDRVKNIVPEKN